MNQSFNQQWQTLKELSKDESVKDLKSLFEQDSQRTGKYSLEFDSLYFDFSKNWLNDSTLENLISLAESADLETKITNLFKGEKVNISENKSATHVLSRKSESTQHIEKQKKIMFQTAEKYRSGIYKTAFGKKIDTVVNIGIGGSYLGPRLAIDSLSSLQTNNKIKVHYYPSVDSATIRSILQKIDLSKTLFCISSKSLGTIETKRNTDFIINLLQSNKEYSPSENNQSLVIATANLNDARLMGIPMSHILPFSDTVGGRFSVWSSIGFPLLLAIGEEKFKQFLAGAEKADSHFKNTDYKKNIPVMMALISIWYRNFMKLSAYAVIPYDVRMKSISSWLQQLMMESNGKSVDIYGQRVDYETSPIVFGDHGQLSQHAFFQAFHQGREIIPIDFIGVLERNDSNQTFLLANMLAQSAALMRGNPSPASGCGCPGNRPSSVILMKELTPNSLGILLAFYEHMIFTQSVIWNINCFDQPGVELGKKLAKDIINQIENHTNPEVELDTSTMKLLSKVLNYE